MTTRRNHRDKSMTFTCDDCGEEFESQSDDFHEARDEFKDEGGCARLECGEWMHFCKDCK